jgi:N-acetylglutamate synthase-like GNAT family acetyltransferase
VIRQATIDDFDAVLELNKLLELYEPFRWSEPQWVRQQILDGRCFLTEPMTGAMCVSNVDGTYAIDSIVVAPEYRKRGVGKELVDFAISRAREEKLSKLLVLSYCDYHVEKFYERCGFEKEGISWDRLPYWNWSMRL